ncbi:MAG: tyrosine-type recombinase/integrase [Burkholderiales bacterium]
MAERLLTEKHLTNAKPHATDHYLPDGGGLYARVLKGDSKGDTTIVFQYRFKLDGRTGYFHCGTYPVTSLAEARGARDEARKLVSKGIHPARHERRRRDVQRAQEQADKLEKTVEGLFEDWERVYLKRHRKDGGALVRQFVEADVLPKLGAVKAKDVTRRQIVQVIDAISDRGANRKANAVLSMVKQMFKHGLARGIVEVDPTTGLGKEHAGGRERPRDRNLSFEEVSELANALLGAELPTHLQAAVWLLLATGARVAELIHARWVEFDLTANTWTIAAERSKNGKPHLVHLSAFARRWVDTLAEKRENDLLFPGRQSREPMSEKWLGKCLRDRQRSTPLKNRTRKTRSLILSNGEWRAHDLRRTMASRMGDLGVTPYVVEKCLNHSLGGLLKVYQHQEYVRERQVAFDLWGAKLETLVLAKRDNVIEIGKRAPRKQAVR